MNVAKIDIIVPVYNPGPEFRRTMASLLAQTHPCFRIILIDDGSVIGRDIISHFDTYPCVKWVRLPQNQGGGHARNAGLQIVEADYVAFCDSDDIWPHDKIEKQISFMSNNDICMSHCDVVVVNHGRRKVISSSDYINLWGFLKKTDLYCSTVCLSSGLAKKHRFGRFRKRHPFAYWVSILESGVKSVRCPETNVHYVVREGSVSSKRYSTFFYTLLAYIWFPKNKMRGIGALLFRCTLGLKGNSRILGRF